MSKLVPLRSSSQVTIAPPAPSDTIAGLYRSFGAVQSLTPSWVHCGTPAALTRWASMLELPLRASCHATIAPPEPSDTIVGLDWSLDAVHRPTPSVVHWGTPAAFTRWI